MDYPVSDTLQAQLSGQKTRGTTAGTVKPSIMSWANDLIDEGGFDEDHSPSGGEDLRPETTPRPTLRIIRARPFLAILDGGR